MKEKIKKIFSKKITKVILIVIVVVFVVSFLMEPSMETSLIMMPIILSIFVGGMFYSRGQKYCSIVFMIFVSSFTIPLYLSEFIGIDFGHSLYIWIGMWIIIYIYFLKKHRGILEKLDEELGKRKSKK